MNVLSNSNNHIQLSVHSPVDYQVSRLHSSSDNIAGLFYLREKSATMTKGNGKPCRRCGTSEWYNSGACKECGRRNSRKWKENNQDKIREYSYQYYHENKEALNKKVRVWRRDNPEKVRRQKRRWRRANPKKAARSVENWVKSNPGKSAAIKRRYRAKRAEADGDFSPAEFKALCEQYNNRCLSCGKKRKLTADHVLPLSMGGSNDISNIQPLCQPCNSGKRDRHIDYRTKPGILRWIQDKLL